VDNWFAHLGRCAIIDSQAKPGGDAHSDGQDPRSCRAKGTWTWSE
jgi:hypothetical protein